MLCSYAASCHDEIARAEMPSGAVSADARATALRLEVAKVVERPRGFARRAFEGAVNEMPQEWAYSL